MPALLVYEHGVVNAVQPEVSAVKVGTVGALGVDANLNQYTSGVSGGLSVSCTDVDGLSLWTVDETDFAALFTAAGAGAIGGVSAPNLLVSPDGTKILFFLESASFLHVGVADINAPGDTSPPLLIGYVRVKNPIFGLFYVVGVSEMGVDGSLLVQSYDFSTLRTQFWVLPSIADLEAGTFKGSHPGVSDLAVPLAADQAPTYVIRWSHGSALKMGYGDGLVQDGNVRLNHAGFYAVNFFWWVMPKAWMENGNSGLSINWAEEYPGGGVFRLDLNADQYADHSWLAEQDIDTPEITDDAIEVTTSFVPPLPWAEEYTRIYDGADNDGWLASYTARPVVFYPPDGLPILLFSIIDGNATYEDDVGGGERIFYAKVRGYKWTGAAWVMFDSAEGIVLRQGDLGYSGYNFNNPESQNAFMVDGDIYLQICQWTGMGGAANSRSILTQFGRFIESETRQVQTTGRVRYVSRS
jgi:hypothetical protein